MSTTPNLIQRFNQRDPKAFQEIYNKVFLRLYNFAKKQIQVREEVEDIVSESFVKLWCQQGYFNSLESIYSFLFTTVKNSCTDYLRKQQRKIKRHERLISAMSNTYLQGEYHSNYHDDIKTIVIKDIYDQIEQLPEKCKRIFKMSYIDQLPGKEIADRLKIDHQTVRNQLYIGLKSLRTNFSNADLEKYISVILVFFSIIS